MYYLFIYNFKIFNLLIYFNLFLRNKGIYDAGAKEIAQNFIHLKGLTKFVLILE